MSVISPARIDAAFELAERINGAPVEFHVLVETESAPHEVPLARHESQAEFARFSFDHRQVDGHSALALLSGSASEADWRGRERGDIRFDDPRSARMPRRRGRRFGRRIAWLMPRGTRADPTSGSGAPLLIRVPRSAFVAENGRSVVAELVGRLHRAALHGGGVTRANTPRYSAVLVPLDGRRGLPPAAAGAARLGNLSSSELSVARHVDEVDAEVDWFFARVGRSRLWSLHRLSRYGGHPRTLKTLIVAIARALKVPKETAIVSCVQLDDVHAALGAPLFLEVPRRHPRTLAVGVVETTDMLYVCLGTRADPADALRAVRDQLFAGVELSAAIVKE